MPETYENEVKVDEFNEQFGQPQPIQSSTSSLDPGARRNAVVRISMSSLGVGGNVVGVNIGDKIQTAIDNLVEQGGGTVELGAGTFISDPIIGHSSVNIVGISPSATVIDFNSTSGNLSFAGTNLYNTGTITSITSGVNVTGSGTSWLSNVTAGQYLFIDTRHYKIAAVTSDTTLILSEGYTDNVTLPASYRITTPIVDVKLSNFTVTGSTGTGITFDDALQITIDNVQSNSCNKGFVFTNVSRMNMDRVLTAANTSNGYEFTNIGLCDWESTNSSANGGHGFVFNNVKTLSGLLSCQSSTSDGFNFTDCEDMTLILESSGNGGQGVEMVSGCNTNHIVGIIRDNTSDGIKLTATCDNNTLGTGLTLIDNGGYGINIAASTCDNNTIAVPYFENNTSGRYNDAGTNTNIVVSVPSGFQFTGAKSDGLTETEVNATITRDLLTSDAQYSNGGNWRLDSGTFGQVDNTTDFNWQNADYIFTARVKAPTAAAWSGTTEGRSYFWGLAESGLNSFTQDAFSQKTDGLIRDESYVGFYVAGDDNLYAISGTGEEIHNSTGLASMEVTDLSAYDHTTFHDYKIETHYDTFPAISNSGFIRPTAHSGGRSDVANMYDSDTNTFGFSNRGNSDCVALSWDGGTSFTPVILNSVQLTKTAVTLGGQYDTWGRTWSPSDFSNANFSVRVGNITAQWGASFDSGHTNFTTFGFDTSTWEHITGIEIELTSETEDAGDGGTAEHKIYDIRVKVYYTTTENTGFAKFYIDDTLVATHQVSIPRNTDNPKILFGSVNGINTSDNKFILFNNYQLTADTN